MNLPTISIITPSYNQGEFIERTLLSILSQSYKPVEYLVYDGGSNDQTVNILKKWEADLRWQSEPDDGQAAAINKGLKACRGEIIGWINSDDTYNENALKNIAIAFNNNPNIDVIYGRALHIDEYDEIINEYGTAYWDKALLLHQCFICQPALFFRRKLIQRVGLLDESLNFCMDYEYWIRLSKSGCQFGYLNEIVASSRLYKENKTLFNRPAVHKEIVEMLKKETGWVSVHWIKAYSSTIVRTRYKNSNKLMFAYHLAKRMLITQWRYNANLGIRNVLSLIVAKLNQRILGRSMPNALK